MFKKIKQYFKAQYWLEEAKDMMEAGRKAPKEWDCDVRRNILIDKMEKSGLEIRKDFVVCYCRAYDNDWNLVKHTFLELFGTNKKRKRKYQLNGYRIDPANTGKIYELYKSPYYEWGPNGC